MKTRRQISIQSCFRIGFPVFAACLLCSAVSVTGQPAQYAIVISVDGLGGAYLTNLFNPTNTLYPIPNFKRLKNEGASTFWAHIDNNNWETLPNHISIVTARPQVGADGHNWISNSDPGVAETIHSVNGSYVAGVFDVAHDNGLRTGMYANKSKFSLFDTNASYTGGGSYNAVYGGPDTTGVDNGRDKIDNTCINTALGGVIVDTFIAQQKTNAMRYTFLHINEPDRNGHTYGWGSPTWNSSVVSVDTMLGKLFKLAEQDVPAMISNTVLIVTADHGNQDNPPTGAHRYAVPIFVWGLPAAAGADLYTLNASTRRVASTYPMTTYGGMQPIRNAEVNNLALQLLGFGPIPGSSFNYTQELKIAPAFAPVLTGITSDGAGNFTIRGTSERSGEVVLWQSASLGAPVWLPIQTNTVSAGVPFSFAVAQGAQAQTYFRLSGQ